MTKFILIAAVGLRGELGRHGALPWRLPADMKHFRDTTMGHAVVMGYKTALSLEAPLVGRSNWVISTRGCGTEEVVALYKKGFLLFPSPEAIIAKASSFEKVFVIGGSKTYEQFLPYCDEMILTEIDYEFEADVYFPQWRASDWEVIDRKRYAPSFLRGNLYHYAIAKYGRRKNDQAVEDDNSGVDLDAESAYYGC